MNYMQDENAVPNINTSYFFITACMPFSLPFSIDCRPWCDWRPFNGCSQGAEALSKDSIETGERIRYTQEKTWQGRTSFLI